MEVPDEAISPEVGQLLDELRNRGFTTEETRYSWESFGDAIIVLQQGGTVVRLSRDRGQWFIEVAAGEGDWMDPVIWNSFLESVEAPTEAVRFDDQAKMLLGDLPRIRTFGADPGEEAIAKLRSIRKRRWEGRSELGR